MRIMNKKLMALVVALCVFALPLMAIVSGRPLTLTLKDLCYELQMAYQQLPETQQRIDDDYEQQHQRLLSIVQQSDKLSILLYTQEQEMTFDLAYALKKVTAECNEFSQERRPYDHIVNTLNVEIDRYARLIEALRRIPPVIEKIEAERLPDSLQYQCDSLSRQVSEAASPLEREVFRIVVGDSLHVPFFLDKAGKAVRDSCIRYASGLLMMHVDNLATVMADSSHYQEVYLSMQETRKYAETRYRELERYVFVAGQTPFMDIVRNRQSYWNKTKADLRRQYSLRELASAFNTIPEGVIEEEEATFFEHFSSRAENIMLVVLCILQLLFLSCYWLLTRFVLWLICRIKRVGRLIPQKQRPVISLLVGTIIYFLTIAFDWGGTDEYVQMGARHINTFLWLLIAITGSLLLRVKTEQIRHCFKLYIPTIFIALVIISCRITFIPDKLLVLLFPPLLFLIVLRQLFFCIRERGKATSTDITLGWVSLAIYLIALVFAFLGYTFIALLILVWWYFLLAAWLTIVCISDLLAHYKERWLDKRVAAMRERITYVAGEDRESLLFGATWFYDLIRQVAIPTLVLLSLPVCVSFSLSIFDFDDLFLKFYEAPFIHLFDKDGFETLRVSVESIVNLLILFCVLHYVSRALHTIWQYIRYTSFMRKHNRTTIRVNEVNLSLGNSIITALIWMLYAVVVIYVWKIPTGSFALVAGGLSAGIGLALKDTINNFIYGIQLLGGRMRVGDWIECDGVRGKVTSINYQCVQAETVEGTEVSFLNSSLFGKNFTNLTRNNSYELITLVVGVSNGTDVKQVREVLVNAMQQMRTKDNYGREIVDPKYGIYVVVSNMSNRTVDIGVKQYVLVAERIPYVDRAKEVIYEALTSAGIPIASLQYNFHLLSEK